MDRAARTLIEQDLSTKVVLLSGPRQVGKTTLAKAIFPESHEYLNYDFAEHRLLIAQQSWKRQTDLIIFDELHKKKNWKAWLKGIYDVDGVRPRLLVTGSSKLNTYRKVGDSMAGRYLHHRLHPLDPKELKAAGNSAAVIEQLLLTSGFPEPFLDGRETFYKRWRKSHIEVILRQDLLASETVSDIRAMETLIELLRSRVGASVSYSNLARDVEKDPKTIKRWLEILENHYVIFRVTPYHRNIARSLLKEPKFYFYDTALVVGDRGAQLENIAAVILRKELDRLEDAEGARTALHVLRTKDGREIDFAVSIEGRICHLFEVKATDDVPSPHFRYFKNFLPLAKQTQLVGSLRREKSHRDGPDIRSFSSWCAEIDFST